MSLKTDLDCPKIKRIVKQVKAFWKKADKDKPLFLSQPQKLLEFEELMKSLQDLVIEDISNSQMFLDKLILSTEVQTIELFNNSKIKVQILIMPPKYFFRIHDHPEMLLVLKILQGEAEVAKYNLLNSENIYMELKQNQFSKAVGQKKEVLKMKGGDIDLVHPDHCNLHSINCVKRVVMLDIMINSYEYTNRPCSYFELGEHIQDNFFELFHFKQ